MLEAKAIAKALKLRPKLSLEVEAIILTFRLRFRPKF